jgi:hypothetical protein
MGDPLSIVSGCLAVIQASAKVVKLCYDYQDTVRGAPDDLKRIGTEIKSVQETLEIINGLLEKKDSHGNPRFPRLAQQASQRSLKDYLGVLKELGEMLEGTKWRRRLRKMIWPLRKGRLVEIQELISRERQSLNLILQADNM